MLLDKLVVSRKTCHTLHPTTLLPQKWGPKFTHRTDTDEIHCRRPCLRREPRPSADGERFTAGERGRGCRTRRDRRFGEPSHTGTTPPPGTSAPNAERTGLPELASSPYRRSSVFTQTPGCTPDTPKQTWGLSLSRTTGATSGHSGDADAQGRVTTNRTERGGAVSLPPATMRPFVPPGRTQHGRQTCLSAPRTEEPDEGRRRGFSVTSKAR